ncbi:MAG: RNA polymerase sigma factor [Clostridiales bacterium]|nr:RNA polymerase sigma factor [Clostridiales bacterium]
MNREEKLCKEMKKGNRSAANELVEIYYAEIFRYCCWHTYSREQAEDATQETFLKFVRYIDAYKHRGMLRAFLYRIAKNTCVDLSRKKDEEMLHCSCRLRVKRMYRLWQCPFWHVFSPLFFIGLVIKNYNKDE